VVVEGAGASVLLLTYLRGISEARLILSFEGRGLSVVGIVAVAHPVVVVVGPELGQQLLRLRHVAVALTQRGASV
jgi:hypothetical protein